jgi:oxygen-independent coproporphyrinogen III oxidase
LQATQDRLLAELGRLHDFAGFESAFTAARRAGFDNLNADLMYGLPGQTIADWRESVKRLSDLEPEHISAYALTVEERTAFGRHGVVPDDDLQADMYDWAADFLESLGFAHYEISNFARPGRECRHNLKYWTSRPYIGVGVSAASCDARGVRRQNAPDLTAYLSAVESGRPCVVSEECLPEPEKVGETLMLSLRLKDGIVPGPRGEELYGDCLNRYAGLGFLHRDPATQAYRPTRLGWRLSNRLFEDLLSPAV